MDATEILYGQHDRQHVLDQAAEFDLFAWARLHRSELAWWCWRHPWPLIKLLQEQARSFDRLTVDQLCLLTPNQGDDKLMFNYRQQPGEPRMTVFIDPLAYLEDFSPGEQAQLRDYAEKELGLKQ